MSILRILNAFRNRLGKVLNTFSPPQIQIFYGTEDATSELIFIANRWDYGSRFSGDGYEYRRFIPAFRKLFKTVYFMPVEMKEKIIPSIKKINLSDKKTNIFSVFQDMSAIPQDYFKLSKQNFFLINWVADDDMQFDVFSKYVAPKFNLNITTFEPYIDRYRSLGCNVLASQWAGIEGYEFLENRRYLACFIGRMYGKRKNLFRELKKVFGDLVFFHDTRVWPISERRLLYVYQNSWLAIDEPTSHDGKNLQIKGRIFENASLGCLVLTKANSRLLKYYKPNEEILFWNDMSDLVKKIKECAQNPEPYKEMARLAYRRTHREHLYEHRFIDIINSLKLKGGARF